MKKILVGLLALLLALSFAGCGAKKKLEEKAAEALAEKILGGAGVDADINGDKVVIKGEDGQELTIGEGEWPSSDLAKSIPEFKGGKVISVMETKDSLLIILEEASEKDFADYLNEIKETFTEEAYDMQSDGNVTYAAKSSKGTGVILTYTTDKTLSITVAWEEKI